jgi:hypothetical protein
MASHGDKKQLLRMIGNANAEFGSAQEATTQFAVVKAKMELDAIEAATRAAKASERNATIMLWSTICATISAVASCSL